MNISADVIRLHLEYNAWARARLLEAAARLTAEELTRDFGTADGTVLATLIHIYAADDVWLGRVVGEKREWRGKAAIDLGTLIEDWSKVVTGWRDWAAAQTDESLQQAIEFTDLKGKGWRAPLWQVVLHVVNHATQHRGQVAGFLRAMGHAPPNLDLAGYYRAAGLIEGL